MAEARSLYPHWESVGREQVSQLRASSGRCGDLEAVELLVGELSVRSPEFARMWATNDVGWKRRGRHDLVHPSAGALRLELEGLALDDPPGRILVAYLPADDATSAAIEDLAAGEDRVGSSGRSRLRVVDGA